MLKLSKFVFQIGPHFIPGPLDGDAYHYFLGHALWPLCRRAMMPRVTYNDIIWFQQDGAPAHTSRQCLNYLKETRFPGRVISKNGNVNWPPRSPDLNPLDYFLWGHVKSQVYKTPIANGDDLKEKICQALRTVDADMCVRSTQNLIKRARCCIAMDGGHFEHVLHL